MGLEEDNIRKHTTPAYRAPEMWDLFRREVISVKVDIWALGCLLYRICYLKSAFDGESKLQILNGNYRIPESPKYSALVTGLIKNMLEASPDARPDIMQLPLELRMHLSDGSTSAIGLHSPIAASHEGAPKKTSSSMPRRIPPPSSGEQIRNISPQHTRPPQGASKPAASSGGSIGAFWSTQHAKDSTPEEDKGSFFDKQKINRSKSVHSQNNEHHNGAGYPLKHSASGNSSMRFEGGLTNDFKVNFFRDDMKHGSQETRASAHPESKSTFQNEAFKLDSSVNGSRSRKEELEAEVGKLKEQLKQVTLEKAEVTSKYENLSTICRSQRQELQELKRALAAASTSPPIKDTSRSQTLTESLQPSIPVQQREVLEGGLWELQQGMLANSLAPPSPEPKAWQAFVEEPKAQPAPPAHHVWNSGIDGLVWPPTCIQGNNSSQRFSAGEAKKVETTQPAGWAGF